MRSASVNAPAESLTSALGRHWLQLPRIATEYLTIGCTGALITAGLHVLLAQFSPLPQAAITHSSTATFINVSDFGSVSPMTQFHQNAVDRQLIGKTDAARSHSWKEFENGANRDVYSIIATNIQQGTEVAVTPTELRRAVDDISDGNLTLQKETVSGTTKPPVVHATGLQGFRRTDAWGTGIGGLTQDQATLQKQADLLLAICHELTNGKRNGREWRSHNPGFSNAVLMARRGATMLRDVTPHVPDNSSPMSQFTKHAIDLTAALRSGTASAILRESNYLQLIEAKFAASLHGLPVPLARHDRSLPLSVWSLQPSPSSAWHDRSQSASISADR